MITVTTPAIDMLIFALFAYAVMYFLYTKYFKRDFSAVSSADLKFSVIMILLVVINYYGTETEVYVWGITLHWLPYYLVVSGLIEIVYFLVYKKRVGLSWKEIGTK